MNFLFINIIKEYKSYREKNPEFWLVHTGKQKNLSDAIKSAVLSDNQFKKRHPHQYRIKQNALDEFFDKLLKQIEELKGAKDFDNLFKLIEKVGNEINDIGEMTIYDVAERIGVFLSLIPEKIYLHAGAREGAEKLLKKKIETTTIERNDLPEEFNDSSLTCSELEDILCMYKDKF